MAQSTFITRQFPSTRFVESCGAVLFRLDQQKIEGVCLLKLLSTGEWLLPKGRRNIGESRQNAAIREVHEETGFRCYLLPVRMSTRACSPDAPADASDVPHISDGAKEPFMCTIRELPHDDGVKIIWWYVAGTSSHSLDGNGFVDCGPGEDGFMAEFFPCEEAVQNLHFEQDREVLQRAIQIVEDTVMNSGIKL